MYPGKFDPNATVTHRIINKLRYEISTVLPIESFDVQLTTDARSERYIVNVLMKFFGQDKKHINTETNTIVTDLYVPVTWWDHFKQDYFPIWLQIYFPINYNRFDHSVHNTTNIYETKICPHLQSDRDEMHIQWLLNE